jgi:murein DD-endopeptidase MepM/ murein hydrolase activator NlpD
MGEVIAEMSGRGGMRFPASRNYLRMRGRSPRILISRLMHIATVSAAVAFAVLPGRFARPALAADPGQETAEGSAVTATQSPASQPPAETVNQPTNAIDQATPSQSPDGQSRPETLVSHTTPNPENQSGSVAQFARQAVAEARRLLASTGLNIDRLFPQLASDRGGQGGPFIPPPKGDQPNGTEPDKLQELNSLIRSLPLAVPLDYYQLESRFGPRHDPFNRRPSFHTGIDLSAPYMSPVHATAAGVVIYAGYLSDYGKVVEIAHGNGIATVYGHLHRYIVSVGQQVAQHEQIGFLGSSGRSSGPHVHYEVRVNDEPLDPEKFIGLARVIPVTDR